MLSFIAQGFKSLYRSGAAFSEEITPKWLAKTGLPATTTAKIGGAAGGILGLASIATGACFLAAIPLSLPMFLVASGIFASKGIAAAVFVTGFLGGVGTVVTTTGLGMGRALAKDTVSLFRRIKHLPAKHSAPLPQKTSFNSGASAKPDFSKAVKAPEAAGQAIPVPAPALVIH